MEKKNQTFANVLWKYRDFVAKKSLGSIKKYFSNRGYEEFSLKYLLEACGGGLKRVVVRKDIEMFGEEMGDWIPFMMAHIYFDIPNIPDDENECMRTGYRFRDGAYITIRARYIGDIYEWSDICDRECEDMTIRFTTDGQRREPLWTEVVINGKREKISGQRLDWDEIFSYYRNKRASEMDNKYDTGYDRYDPSDIRNDYLDTCEAIGCEPDEYDEW